MITVTISETNGKRKWSHRARTKDAMTAITPDVTVTGHIWKPMWQKGIRWNVKGSAVTVTLHNSSL